MKVVLLTGEYPPHVRTGAAVSVEHLGQQLARHVAVAPGQPVHGPGASDASELVAQAPQRVRGLARERGGVVWVEAMLPRPDAVQLLPHAPGFVCPCGHEPPGVADLEVDRQVLGGRP